jgi:hypothetical protein
VNAFHTSPTGAGTMTSITKACSAAVRFAALFTAAFSAPRARRGATTQAIISQTVKTVRIFRIVVEFMKTLLT